MMGISGLRIKMGEVGVKLEGTVQPVNPSRKQPPSPLGTQDSFAEPPKHWYPCISQKSFISHYLLSYACLHARAVSPQA